jgi:hypothetical protein
MAAAFFVVFLDSGVYVRLRLVQMLDFQRPRHSGSDQLVHAACGPSFFLKPIERSLNSGAR